MLGSLPRALRFSLSTPHLLLIASRPLSRTMAGQKRIETFFTRTNAKRSKATEGENGAGPATAEAQKNAAPTNGDLDTATAPAVATGNGTTSPALAGDGDLHSRQVSTLQAMRAHANRNCALAKQVVIRAEQSGSVPILGDLLIEPSWRDLLADQLTKPYFNDLQSFVQSEWKGGKLIFPPKDSVFRAFNSCPVDKVRVVILGQDPYHDIGQAQGLSFSVPKGKQIPSSLRNIYKELHQDLKCPIATHGCLEKWSHQGVLLLNAVLTVRAHNAASHGKKGWEKFTDEAISRLSKERSGIVFILWGKYAQEKGKVIDAKKHHVLTSAHPSGLSANRGFFGCRHFSKCNEMLEKEGELPIDWCID